jgi:glycosyltransferase involved in cell wall biosynthesis
MDAETPRERRPIVVFGDDWGRHVSSMQHLFRHIARDHDVIWVNAIGHRVPGLSRQDIGRALGKARRLFSRGKGATATTDTGSQQPDDIGGKPRAIIHPTVLPWHHYRLVRAFNARSLTRAIRKALAAVNSSAAPVLVTGSPPSVSVFGRFEVGATVYYCMDDFLHLPNVSPAMLRPLERELLDRVDALVATARALVVSKRPRSGRAYYLPQGVNFEHFAAARAVPPDLAQLPRPIIGFAGGLATPVDLPLLRRLSEANPRGSVVLIGPVHVDLSAIRAPNVHVLGPRPYRDLPAYVQAFDVGIIPYVLNEHTVAVDPLKLLEYLAAGIPVVTTDLPEVHKYREAVAIAPTHDDFVAAVNRALDAAPEDTARRQSVAREQGWDRRADSLLEILREVTRARGVS